MSELIRELPAVALLGITVMPGQISRLDIHREKSIRAVRKAQQNGGQIFLVTQRNEDAAVPEEKDLFRIGVIADVTQAFMTVKDTMHVVVRGRDRAELLFFLEEEEHYRAQVIRLTEDADALSAEVQSVLMDRLRTAAEEYGRYDKRRAKEISEKADRLRGLESYMNSLCSCMPFSWEQRQRLLEVHTLKERCLLMEELIRAEIEILQIRLEIQKKTQKRIDKNQRDYILREQMKVIRQELGDDSVSDVSRFEEALGKLDADESVKERIAREIERFKTVSVNPSEGSVSRTYIETLLDFPWNKRSQDNNDLANAERILNEDHYGLEKVKERILEFLAVRCLTSRGESPIICLVGPPGTGKTSIARSVARALEKKYVRISLGGVRDEAEIRGHRRTYIGSMPGRIVQGIRNAGVKNPLMLLDEIDKMSSDYKGDTASALLEVLDSEQNSKFTDHYMDLPVDLSEVLFICTANDLHTIPRPLLDRMELIEVTSYTQNEKMHIAREHLIGKQKESNGLKPEQLEIEDDALFSLIGGYTREAGVRNLERRIGELCRKAAREIYEGRSEQVCITTDNLEDYLGKQRFRVDQINEKDEVGIVRGLAWTSVGGDTLQIEVNVMPGKGEFRLTGQLGDVMKESAQAGISYIRSVSETYHIAPTFFTEHDIHIHIPEGAVPKDGPSAGITMATAMLSAITGRAVRADVAMTGEITLRGRVLPIGGLKEKLLAAKTAGICTVCVPEKNRPDVEEISDEIKEGLSLCFVSEMKEVLQIALVPE